MTHPIRPAARLDLDKSNQRWLALADAVGRAIDEADPIGLLKTGAPSDEYSSELRSVLPRVTTAAGLTEVTDILHEEFSRWFGASTAGPKDAYEPLAVRIWQAVQTYRQAG